MPHRRHHQVPRRVRELVEQHERPLAAVDDEARLTELAGGLAAEDAALRGAGLLHVCEAPRRPELFHSASCTSTIAAAAAPTPGRARAVPVHREPAPDRGERPVDRRRRDPHDGDRRARRRGRGLRALVRRIPPPRCRPTTASTPTRIVQCVREEDIAWHARGGNTNSIGIELAGFAGQRALGWSDAYSRAVVERAARLTADVCARHGIPLRRLRAADLVAGRRGDHRSRRRQRGVPQERPLGSRPRLPVDAVPAPSAQQRRRRARHAGLTRPRRARRA